MGRSKQSSRLHTACKDLQEYASQFTTLSQEVTLLAEVHERHLDTLEERLRRCSQLQQVWQEQSSRLHAAEEELAALRGQVREQCVELEQTRSEWERTKSQLTQSPSDIAEFHGAKTAAAEPPAAHHAGQLQEVVEKLREECAHLHQCLTHEQRQAQDQRAEWAEELKLLQDALQSAQFVAPALPPAPTSLAPTSLGPKSPVLSASSNVDASCAATEALTDLDDQLDSDAASAGVKNKGGTESRRRGPAKSGAQKTNPGDALLDAVLNQFASLRGHSAIAPAYNRGGR